MGQLKLNNLTAFKSVTQGEEADAIMHFMLTDPREITLYHNFFKNLIANASEEKKKEYQATIDMLIELAQNQVKFTANQFSFEPVAVKEFKVENGSGVETKVETKVKSEDVKLKIVAKNGEDVVVAEDDKVLREKYAAFIKQINVDALKLKVAELHAAGNDVEAEELSTFILGKGLYSGKKAKKWSAEAITKWFEAITKPVEDTIKIDPNLPLEEQLKLKYASYIPLTTEEETVENAKPENERTVKHLTTIEGLKAECKYLATQNKLDEMLEIAQFLLTNGYYASSTEEAPIKWTTVQVEDFIKGIKDALDTNSSEVKVELSPDTAPTAEKILAFYDEIKAGVMAGKTEEEAKAFIFEAVKNRNIETVTMFYKKENTPEELESMYVTMFKGPIAEAISQRDAKSIDVPAEIETMVSKCKDDKEKTLAKIIGKVVALYNKKGEKVSGKEAKEQIYKVAEEKFPEYYAEVLSNLKEEPTKTTKEDKPAIVTNDLKKFKKDHPALWEEVKNASTLEDVYNMAREQEKRNSFTIVSEMITHLINSGKIKDEKGEIVKWDTAQIELWINLRFKNAETPEETTVREAKTKLEAEAKAKVSEIETAKTEGSESPTIATAEVADAGKADSTGNSSETVKTVNDTFRPADAVGESVENPAEVVNTTVDTTGSAAEATAIEDKTAVEINLPKGVVVPEEDTPYKELYADKKAGLWQGILNLIKKMEAEGKQKTEIIHELADKLKSLAQKDELKQTAVHQWKRSNIQEVYNTIKKVGREMGLPNWQTA